MTSAVLVQRSNQLSYQANWELVTCEFVIYPYQVTMMPFGLCNAPASFQQLIKWVLSGRPWAVCL